VETVDKDLLDKCITTLRNTGHACDEKRVIDIFYTAHRDGGPEKKPIASIFPDDRYIQFHDEFTQIGVGVPGLDILSKTWENNHT